MKVAIDVGYGFVKGVAGSGERVRFPSVVAPAQELVLSDLAGREVGHLVELRRLSGAVERYFVGELALKEGRAQAVTLDRDKHLHPYHSVLLLAAARLLGAGSSAELCVGLPVAYYRPRREELKRHLMGLSAEVSVDGSPAARVSFSRVLVYPQGAGALLTAADLPESGLTVTVDVGFKTTDFVTCEVQDGKALPVSSLCGSLEVGVHTALYLVQAAYQARTGAPLDFTRAERLLREGRTFFRGEELDFSREAEMARLAAARSIADGVLAVLGSRADEVAVYYLAGGGAEALPQLRQMLPGRVRVLPDPTFANALGFLKVLSGSA
ncbi:hypothetical protein Adeg_0813 [Ammonifex degensii KC4]|uniref:Uncharacterized protein n=1 Tax=Ammonifex degensii (strain DSM 10501 / KC4) TaxID=429009 RepID=C9RCH8_AMMDK|nr:ParM/StbA family protein [Ammonifex degensii]ACX51955.1 hypothetical protein Adeg_0813 [Ammonifex degensii KC4]